MPFFPSAIFTAFNSPNRHSSVNPTPPAPSSSPPQKTTPDTERIWLGVANSTGAGDLAALLAFRDGLEGKVRGRLEGESWGGE